MVRMRYKLQYFHLENYPGNVQSIAQRVNFIREAMLEDDFAISAKLYSPSKVRHQQVELVKVWSEYEARFLTRSEIYPNDSQFRIETDRGPDSDVPVDPDEDMLIMIHEELQDMVDFHNNEWEDYCWQLVYEGFLEAPF